MDRRGFLGKLAGLALAPLAVVGLVKAKKRVITRTYWFDTGPVPGNLWEGDSIVMQVPWVPKEEIMARYGGK